ncbi:MAG: hypothetical protein ABFD20_09490 [Anaerolineales bacterium]
MTVPHPPRRWPFLRLVFACALALTGVGCSASAPRLDGGTRAVVRSATRGQRFSIARWEIEQLVFRRRPARPSTVEDATQVRAYVDLIDRLREVERQEQQLLDAPPNAPALAELRAHRDALLAERDALRPIVERTLAQQVRAAYRQAGIYNPGDRFGSWPVSFPPLSFTLDSLPHLLVISPRDHIESVYEALLSPDLTTEQMEAIEAAVEAQGYSALVTEIGGLGATYPTFVQDSSNLRWLTGVVAEEWLHQYLAFTPTGFRYLLDRLKLRPDDAIARINEGAATIVSEEIALDVLATHYPEHLPSAEANAPSADDASDDDQGFAFNREMRLTRLHVDELLAAGQVDEAEAYMEERRLVFVAHGYRLRKLNQAYFAFHGNYAVPSSQEAPLPEELVDPLGAQLQALRAQSSSLADFVAAVATLRSAEDLSRAVAP